MVVFRIHASVSTYILVFAEFMKMEVIIFDQDKILIRLKTLTCCTRMARNTNNSTYVSQNITYDLFKAYMLGISILSTLSRVVKCLCAHSL